MAGKITNIGELFHRFHACELQVKQGKIASCLISFKDIIDRMPVIPINEKDKAELHDGIAAFLNKLAAHKKFKEIFGEFTFGDTDLDTNLEFIKSMIIAQEQEIVQKVESDEKAAEAQRLEIDREKQKKQEEINKKIGLAISFIDQDDLPPAKEILNESEEIQEAVALHYNDEGMQKREQKLFKEAVQSYHRALVATPEDENIHYNMARAYFEGGKRNKAEEYLGKAMKLNPDFNEGKAFYDYLLKLDQAGANNGNSENKSGGFFKKLFFDKK